MHTISWHHFSRPSGSTHACVTLPTSCILYRILFSFILFLLPACSHNPDPGSMDQPRMSSEEISIQLDLAESYIRGGKNRSALEKLLLVKKDSENNSRVFFDLGHVYSLMGEFPKARESFERAVHLEPRLGDAWNYLGQVYVALDNDTAAQKAYTKALDIPNYLRKEYPAYNMADLYARQGNMAQAETYARMAVDKNWRYIPAYLLLGKILVDQDRVGDAQKWLEQGAESDLENTSIMLALGENLIRLERLNEARQWFKRVIETAPSSDDAIMANNYLESIR